FAGLLDGADDRIALAQVVLLHLAERHVDVAGAGEVSARAHERVVVEDVEDAGDRDEDVVLADLGLELVCRAALATALAPAPASAAAGRLLFAVRVRLGRAVALPVLPVLVLAAAAVAAAAAAAATGGLLLGVAGLLALGGSVVVGGLLVALGLPAALGVLLVLGGPIACGCVFGLLGGSGCLGLAAVGGLDALPRRGGLLCGERRAHLVGDLGGDGGCRAGRRRAQLGQLVEHRARVDARLGGEFVHAAAPGSGLPGLGGLVGGGGCVSGLGGSLSGRGLGVALLLCLGLVRLRLTGHGLGVRLLCSRGRDGVSRGRVAGDGLCGGALGILHRLLRGLDRVVDVGGVV